MTKLSFKNHCIKLDKVSTSQSNPLHDRILLSEEKSLISLCFDICPQTDPCQSVIKVDCETHWHIVEGQGTGIYLNQIKICTSNVLQKQTPVFQPEVRSAGSCLCSVNKEQLCELMDEQREGENKVETCFLQSMVETEKFN